MLSGRCGTFGMSGFGGHSLGDFGIYGMGSTRTRIGFGSVCHCGSYHLLKNAGRKRMKIKLNDQITLDWNDFKEEGIRIEIFGISGSGKSHGIKVIIEEFLRNHIPFVAIDPEGEYASFKEVTDTIVLGGKFADLPLDQSIFNEVLRLLVNKISVVFDISELAHTDARNRMARIIQEKVFSFASQHKKLFLYVVDEARLIAPQKAQSEANVIAADIAQRGRKRGIVPIFGMQRPSEVDKAVLTQCNIHLMGKLQFPTDVTYVKEFLRDAEVSQSEIKRLDQEFFLWTGGKAQKVKFRDKHVKDLGRTIQPGEEIHLDITSSVDLAQSIQQLQETLARKKQEEEQKQSELEQLKERITQLEDEKKSLTKELAQEQEAARVAKKLTLDVEAIGLPASSNHQFESFQAQINELKAELQEAKKKQFIVKIDGELKEIPKEVAKTIAFDEEYILPVDVWGIDIRDGKVLCDDTAFLLLNQITYEERELYFEMLKFDASQDGIAWSRLLDLIPGKGSKTIKPLLMKLIHVGLVEAKRRGSYTYYLVKKLELLKNIGERPNDE